MENEEREVTKEEIAAEKEKKFSPLFFEVGGKMGRFQKGIHWFASVIMTLLTIVIIGAVLVSFIHIPGLFTDILDSSDGSLRALLIYVADIIIAIELVYVIIAQNLESVIEILMIAFTRELIIKDWEMWELLLGVAVIAGLFAIRKYLIGRKK